MDDRSAALAAYFIVLGIAVALTPVLRYVWIGWAAKRKDIMEGIDAPARHAYFLNFNRVSPVSKEDAALKFEELHTQWYGRRFFFIPALILLLALLASLTFVVLTGLARFGCLTSDVCLKLPNTALAAYAGAYMWVVNDFISRARRLDFSPADIHWGTLRLVISVPMGYAFASIDKPHGRAIAFALGAFPLETLTLILRRLTYKWLGLEPSQEDSFDDIERLQGINRQVVERLAKEDITSIVELAYCDPVDLAMRSNLTFNFIIDCMGQALVWLYLQQDLEKVRPLGLRGAIETWYLYQDLNVAGDADDEKRRRAAAENVLAQLAKTLGQDQSTVKMVLDQVACDPFTVFLTKVWTDPNKKPEHPAHGAGV